MCNLPVAVSDCEKIVRAIIYPYHFHKKRPEWTHRAFRPQPGTDRISVIRLTHMGADFCKAEAKKISYGIKVEPHEPVDSENSKRLTEMTQRMFKLAVYHQDPDPAASAWTGALL